MYALALTLSLAALVLAFLNGRSTKKEMKKHMDLIERLDNITTRINTGLANFRAKFAAESAEFRAAVAELKALVAPGSEHTTADLDAAFARLENSVTGFENAAGEIDNIVTDVDALQPEPNTDAEAAATLASGTAGDGATGGPASDFVEPDSEPIAV